MLKLNKIKKVYEVDKFRQVALNDVSLCFRQNEFVSILGPSGSGKTTLLNIIGGLDNYTSGDLIINDVSTKEYKDRDWDTYRNHSVGFVFQSYNLIPHQSVLKNVELALTLSGVSKKERLKRAKDALIKVGLKEHINKKPNQLSGGQMQRVAIARALVNDPDILLADEPTGALDSKTSDQIIELLKEVSNDRLVIMVTHNKEIAEKYSTRIVELLDGKITSDSNPFDGEEKDVIVNSKHKKTSMSFRTALSLSLNNLMTKKGRTFLTAFAGSIGIIGIALILSLSNGIQKYIDKTEEETLSSYPLVIEKDSVDFSAMLQSLSGNKKEKDYNDNKVHSSNIMGDMFETMSKEVKHNDMKKFKKYLDNNNEISKYTSDIKYGYNVTLNLYKDNLDAITRVNPTTIYDALGMGTSGVSSIYNGMMSSNDVFFELIENDKLLENQYNLVAGNWPKNYNEMVLTIGENNQISDYTLYSLGILSQDDLKEKFNEMTSGKEVEFDETSYTYDELLNLKFRLVLSPDYYVKENGLWINKEKDNDYMKNLLANSEEIKIVGIIKPDSESVGTSNNYGMVGYKHELMEHLIDLTNNKDIVIEQQNNKDINVFTGREFSSSSSFDMNDLTQEQLLALSSMSQSEIANFMKDYSENMTSSYEENLAKLGISSLDNPDTISIYPKDFDSKEEIANIIDDYNKNKKEADKIKYTDVVGIMMSSVSTIVNVISSVLIAFVAISLIVSSIMIAIITYISVIERTKEIGILRAIGASKKDISRVFNAETLIEGLAAGVLGIVVTLLIDIPINIIIKNMVDISGIAKLPLDGAIVLIIISVILTVIAGLIPSRIASKKDPVESLRSE